MVTKKDLVVAVLAAFCLSALMFTVIRAAGWDYDPWLDSNHDGKIDIKDIAAVAKQFGAAGDPTVNVTTSPVPGIPPGSLTAYLYIYSAPIIVCNCTPIHPNPAGVGPGIYETCIFVHNPSATSSAFIGKKLVFLAPITLNETYPAKIIWFMNMTLGPDSATEVTSAEIYSIANEYYVGPPYVMNGLPVEGYVCIISTSPYLDVNAYYTVSELIVTPTGFVPGNTTCIDSQIISPKPFITPIPIIPYP
jgi:hypothetical protein